MAQPAAVIVELFGIPRQRAGRAEVSVRACTVGEALAAVERACPQLAGLCAPDGRVAPHLLVSVNGTEFITDGSRPVRPGDRLLVLPADAGG